MRFFNKKRANSDQAVEERIKCSFCYKSSLEVERIISAPNNVYICGDCVVQCVELLVSDKEGTLGSYRPKH